MSDKLDGIPIKLDGKNYSEWEFHMRNFIEGHDLGGFIDGTEVQPKDPTNLKGLKEWKRNNARVISWIAHSVERNISINLRAYTTSVDIWTYLKKLYQ